MLEQLDEQDCRRLVQVAPQGRLTFTEGARCRWCCRRPSVRGDDVIASLVGVEVDRLMCGAVVAFEVDSDAPASQDGWCVSVIGPSLPITDLGLIAELDTLGLAPTHGVHDRGRNVPGRGIGG